MSQEIDQLQLLLKVRQQRINTAEQKRSRAAIVLAEQQEYIRTLHADGDALKGTLRAIESPEKGASGQLLLQLDNYRRKISTDIAQCQKDIFQGEKQEEILRQKLKDAIRKLQKAQASYDAIEQQLHKQKKLIRVRQEKKLESSLDDRASQDRSHTMSIPQTPSSDTIKHSKLPSHNQQRDQKDSPDDLKQQFDALLNPKDQNIQGKSQNQQDKHSGQFSEGGDSADARIQENLRQDTLSHSHFNYQSLAQSVSSQQVSAPATNASQFSDLLAKHVQQMLVSAENTTGKDQQMLIRLSDQVLPNTQIMLSRSLTGWTLKAMSSGRDNLETIKKSSEKLVDQFANAGLGQLFIETELEAVGQS